MPFGGNADPVNGEKHPSHGECSGGKWEFVSAEETGDAVAVKFCFHSHIRESELEKCVIVNRGESVLYFRHTISGSHGTMPLGHHPIIKMPEEGKKMYLSVGEFAYGSTCPGVFSDPKKEAYQILARGAEFRSIEAVPALVRDVDNIVGVKEASGSISQVAKIMSMTDGKIDLYSGNDDQIVPLLSLGGIGVISVLANIAPREAHDICEKYFTGDVAGSAALQLKAIPLIDQLFCEVNPIPVKKAVSLTGFDCGPLRMPLTELTPEHEKSLVKAMKDFGIKLA